MCSNTEKEYALNNFYHSLISEILFKIYIEIFNQNLMKKYSFTIWLIDGCDNYNFYKNYGK